MEELANEICTFLLQKAKINQTSNIDQFVFKESAVIPYVNTLMRYALGKLEGYYGWRLYIFEY